MDNKEIKPCPICGQSPDFSRATGAVYHHPSNYCILGNTSWDLYEWDYRPREKIYTDALERIAWGDDEDGLVMNAEVMRQIAKDALE